MLSVQVSVQRKRRTVPKPTVTISVAKARQLIRKAGLTVEEGKAYVIYDCGHVFENSKDPQILTYYLGENRSIRSCPICVTRKLITKYKLCGCGAEHLGKRVQPSKCCSQCSSLRKATGREIRLDAYKRNSHLMDASRWNCVHWDICRDKYLEYDAVPCKGCNRYQICHGNHDL
jgi:hypothetical protein